MNTQFDIPVPRDYGIFNGRNIDQMPLLITGKNEKGESIDVERTPLSIAGFMKLRLKALDLYANVLENPNKYPGQYRKDVAEFFKWAWSSHADTGDGVLYHPDGMIKIDLDSKFMGQINPRIEDSLRDGAVPLPSDSYATIQMPEFSKAEVRKFTGKPHSGEEALSNKLWRVFARDPNEVLSQYAEDPALLKSYVKAFNFLANVAFNYNNGMGAYVANPERDIETARLWLVGGLWIRSDADGGDDLHDGGGRLVGVAPEAPRLALPSTERLEDIITKLKPHEKEIRQLLTA